MKSEINIHEATAEFPEMLRNTRIKKGLQLQEVAKLAGITKCNLSHYEHGQREPRVSILVKLALALETSVDYLLGINNKDEPMKKCPFCGENAELKQGLNVKNKKIYWVRCKNIKCKVLPETDAFTIETSAITAWNRRT